MSVRAQSVPRGELRVCGVHNAVLAEQRHPMGTQTDSKVHRATCHVGSKCDHERGDLSSSHQNNHLCIV
nr:hypothetical protein HmN_000230600 [Hymenolepis microstoma]